MPAMHSDDDDRPATRRDLAHMREVIEANVRADIAELQVKMVKAFARVERQMEQRFGQMEQRFGRIEARFGKVDSKIAKQTRVLVAFNVLISSAMAAAIIRATG